MKIHHTPKLEKSKLRLGDSGWECPACLATLQQLSLTAAGITQDIPHPSVLA